MPRKWKSGSDDLFQNQWLTEMVMQVQTLLLAKPVKKFAKD